ncbi:MAG: hypothetical protein WCG76_05330, partial [Verrucomicrobiota bacterium]
MYQIAPRFYDRYFSFNHIEQTDNTDAQDMSWHDEPSRTLLRVLLAGDSIVVGHGANFHALLKGRAPHLAQRSAAPVCNGDNRAELGERTPCVVRRNADAVAVTQNPGLPTIDLPPDAGPPAAFPKLLLAGAAGATGTMHLTPGRIASGTGRPDGKHEEQLVPGDFIRRDLHFRRQESVQDRKRICEI